MAYNGWHPGRVARTEGNEARVLMATVSGYEKKHKSSGSRVCHLQYEITPQFLSENSGGRGKLPLHGSQVQGYLLTLSPTGGF